MIVGIGTDLVELARLERAFHRHGQRLIDRICRTGELGDHPVRIQHLGGLFAAKEAVLKALGTGWAQGLSFDQVEIVSSDGGAPRVQLHEQAARHAADLGVTSVLVSISHERSYAVAVAVAESRPTS